MIVNKIGVFFFDRESHDHALGPLVNVNVLYFRSSLEFNCHDT